MLKEKFIASNAYYKGRSKINHLSFYFRKLEKEQIKSKLSIRKEITKIRSEINEIEIRYQ